MRERRRNGLLGNKRLVEAVKLDPAPLTYDDTESHTPKLSALITPFTISFRDRVSR